VSESGPFVGKNRQFAGKAMIEIDARLLADGRVIGRFSLCHVLLMNDANYPWCVLVPDREGAREIYRLSEPDQLQLLRESAAMARALDAVFQPEKLNIAALGNVVPQLHVHHIARFRDDPAWPAPVWGRVPAKPYNDAHRESVVARIQFALAGEAGFVPVT
jgi:diadenosine tetraphosphate (Ap4A) HIT family hydrolase